MKQESPKEIENYARHFIQSSCGQAQCWNTRRDGKPTRGSQILANLFRHFHEQHGCTVTEEILPPLEPNQSNQHEPNA